jgi:hypothetical protein
LWGGKADHGPAVDGSGNLCRGKAGRETAGLESFDQSGVDQAIACVAIDTAVPMAGRRDECEREVIVVINNAAAGRTPDNGEARFPNRIVPLETAD